MSKPLYFVTVSHPQGGTLMGGHWYAADAAAARRIAITKYIDDRREGTLRGEYPLIDLCDIKARRSTSYANALNPEAA